MLFRSKVSAGIAILILALLFSWICLDIQGQNSNSFMPSDNFSIPAYNGIISFAVNGTYSKATYENDNWTFVNLQLKGSQPIANFQVSAQNSNVTILSYRAANNTSFQSVRLSYSVVGQGMQIFNLGLGPEQDGLSSSVEWSVTVNNNVFLAEGEGWTISHSGTLVINGATGNVSIVHYRFNGSFGGNFQNSNLPFYQQHSVAIATVAVVVIVIAIALVFKFRNRASSINGALIESARANSELRIKIEKGKRQDDI